MTDTEAKPEIVEIFPSHEGGISALASANAPIIYFDNVAFLGHDGRNVGSLTLVASRMMKVHPERGAINDHVIVCALKASIPAMVELRNSIDKMLALVSQAAVVGAVETGETPATPTVN